jgi:hypothetical protein
LVLSEAKGFLDWLKEDPLDNQIILQLQAIHPPWGLKENHKANMFCHFNKGFLLPISSHVKAFPF